MIKFLLKPIYQHCIYILRNLSIFKRIFFRFINNCKSKVDYGDYKIIVFFQIYSAGWNSVKPIYEDFLKKPNFKTIVLVSPNTEDIKKSNTSCKNYNFFRENVNEENLVFAYNFTTAEWFNLKSLRPDFVFYNRPYNSEIPIKSLRSSVVASYSKVCFLHYGYSLSNDYSKFWANESFIYYAKHIFAENNTKFKEYKRVLRLQNMFGLVSIHNLGYPRFKLLQGFCLILRTIL